MLKFSQIIEGQKIYDNGFEGITPQVSVVMPTYCRNAEGLLNDCIVSVLNQTYQDFEFIIVDDGSSDGSQQVIETYARQDPRIVYVRHDVNSGLPAARTNEGVLLARASLIAFIFDDNVWKSNALQILVKAVEETGADMVYGDVEMMLPNKAPKRFGTWPITLEIMQLINPIPNGGVLCRKIFFEKYGLYDPHLVLRRTCDWDLWRRALKLGATIQHVLATVGIEHGVVSPVSLGNTVHLDFKISTAYALDDHNLIKRVRSLLPHTISEYDILDPDKILPYLRNFKEWEDVELNLYKPFLERHPEYEHEPLVRHNRHYDSGIHGFGLNPPMAVFKKRQRVLLTGNRYNRIMKDWHDAFSSDPNLIVVTCAEGGLPLFSKNDFDFLILFDCCHVGNRIIGEFQEQGACVIFILEHGLDEQHEAGDPVQLLHLKNYDATDAFVMNTYFPTNGHPWPPEANEIAQKMMDQSDQIFSIQQSREDICLVQFYPNNLNSAALANRVMSMDIVCYAGNPENINLDSLPNLSSSFGSQNRILYILEGSSLPENWASSLSGWDIRVVNDSIFTLAEKSTNTCFLVPDDILDNNSEYERLLNLEDQIRQKNLILPLSKVQDGFDAKMFQSLWFDLIDQWKKRAIGNRADERYLYIRNLVSGVALRKKLADMNGKSRACEVRTAVLINSLLFGGSESYGLMLSEKLRNLGFEIFVVGPIQDVYGSGADKINGWLNAHRFPALLQTDYGSVAFKLFAQDLNEKEIMRFSQEFDKWADEKDFDILFCSGFIAEPAIADNPNRIVYMALFPPWGYNLANMTFLKNKISGLFSDTRWGLDVWTSCFPTPSEVTPSVIDREYFQVWNKNLPTTPVCLAIMGTVIHTKRQKEAMLAVRQLILEGYDLQLNIYGHLLDVYKSYIDELVELAKDPYLSGRVKLHDFVEDPHQVARENHIILSTSIAEGLPQALILNQASGLLPVACPAGGIPEVVIEGETGFLADGFEVEHIITALRRALQKQADWPGLINNGRKLLLNSCTESEFVRRILKVMLLGADLRKSEGAQLFRKYSAGQGSTASKRSLISFASMQIGPMLSKRKVVYPLETDKRVLKGLSFQPGTYFTQPQGEMHIEIFLDRHTEPLREVKLDLSTLRDNEWAKIAFDPIAEAEGMKFRVEVAIDLIGGKVALFERFSENQDEWEALFSRFESRVHQYITLRHKRSAYAFFPL